MNQISKIVRDIKDQFLVDYKECPVTLFLEMFGTFTALIASCTMAYYGQEANFFFAFGNYLTSSISLFIAAILRKNSFLIVLNFGYAIINVMFFIKHL